MGYLFEGTPNRNVKYNKIKLKVDKIKDKLIYKNTYAKII